MKGKTARFILQSYFQLNVMGTITLVVAFIMALAGTGLALNRPPLSIGPKSQIPWDILLIVFILVLWVSILNLRRQCSSQETALFPHYRRFQLIVTGGVVAAFTLWPAVLTTLLGFPPLVTLAVYLSFAALGGWLLFVFGENALVSVALFWTGRFLYETLGLYVSRPIFSSFYRYSPGDSPPIFPVMIIVLSIAALIALGSYVMKVSLYSHALRSQRGAPGFYGSFYERSNIVTQWLIRLTLPRLLRKNRNVNVKGNGNGNVPPSIFALTRRVQLSLFSPSTVFVSQTLFFIIVVAAGIFSWFFLFASPEPPPTDRPTLQFLLVAYYFMGGIVAADLLQHRHCLSGLWLRFPHYSRKAFLKISALSAFLVMLKQYLVVTAGLLAISFFAFPVGLDRLLPLLVLGLVFMIFLLALALMQSDNIVSRESKGWIIGVMLAGSYGLFFFLAFGRVRFYNIPSTWNFILAAGVATLLFLGLGIRKWLDTEMDFAGPESPAVVQ